MSVETSDFSSSGISFRSRELSLALLNFRACEGSSASSDAQGVVGIPVDFLRSLSCCRFVESRLTILWHLNLGSVKESVGNQQVVKKRSHFAYRSCPSPLSFPSFSSRGTQPRCRRSLPQVGLWRATLMSTFAASRPVVTMIGLDILEQHHQIILDRKTFAFELHALIILTF